MVPLPVVVSPHLTSTSAPRVPGCRCNHQPKEPMALSTADLQAAYLRGDRYVTVNAGGVVIETHQFFASADKAGGHPNSTVSSLASTGVLTPIANTISHRRDYGKTK